MWDCSCPALYNVRFVLVLCRCTLGLLSGHCAPCTRIYLMDTFYKDLSWYCTGTRSHCTYACPVHVLRLWVYWTFCTSLRDMPQSDILQRLVRRYLFKLERQKDEGTTSVIPVLFSIYFSQVPRYGLFKKSSMTSCRSVGITFHCEATNCNVHCAP